MVDHDSDTRSDDRSADDDEHADHLADVPDGCGCAEVWEHLSGSRE